MKVFVEL